MWHIDAFKKGYLVMVRRSRPPIMRLTDAAADKVRHILENDDQSNQMLKIGVKNGGCAGMAYTMQLTDERQPSDELVKDKGVCLLVDAKAILFLLGSYMDYNHSTFSSGFIFDNPNQVGTCGCGESVSIIPASPELLSILPDADEKLDIDIQ